MLQSDPATSNSDSSTKFQREKKALHHVDMMTLNWNPSLSVKGKHKNLHSKMEIFLKRLNEEN